MAASSQVGSDEYVQLEEVGSSQRASTDENIGSKPPLSLLPKLLPPRSQLNFPLSLVAPPLVTAISIVALWMLLSQLHRLLPYIRRYPEYELTLDEATTTSCDLETAKASAFEKIFTIDLRSQLHLSFATAKFIDVVWDLVVGQGGRLLLAWISYVVFMDGLARLMETSAVSYQLYASTVFETSSLTSTWRSLKAVSTGHSWRGRIFFAWFGLSTIYVLGYPTLMSATTGYLNPSEMRYHMENNTLIAPDSDDLTECIQIINAHRVGFDDVYIVLGPSENELRRSKESDLRLNHPDFYTLYQFIEQEGQTWRDLDHIKANLSSNVSSNLPSNFSSLTHAPFLGVTLFDQDPRYTIKSGNRTFTQIQRVFCYRNNALPWDFHPSSECLAHPYFIWGFSSVLLYIIVSLQLVWTIGMFMVWLDANLNSELCRKGRKMRGSFRNALDLAEAIREVLGDELCAYSDSEIARHLIKSGFGLQFCSSTDIDSGISHIGLSSLKGGQRLRLPDKSLYGGLGRD